jgi:hypothetical protein
LLAFGREQHDNRRRAAERQQVLSLHHSETINNRGRRAIESELSRKLLPKPARR